MRWALGIIDSAAKKAWASHMSQVARMGECTGDRHCQPRTERRKVKTKMVQDFAFAEDGGGLDKRL